MLESLLRQGGSVLASSGSHEHRDLDRKLNTLHAEYKSLKENAVERKRELMKAVSDRETLHELLEKVSRWLQDKENSFDASQTIPLSSTEVQKQVDEKKVSFCVLTFVTLFN